jgi:hypothetical protein
MIIIVVYILSFLILEYNPDLSLPHAPVVIYAMPHALRNLNLLLPKPRSSRNGLYALTVHSSLNQNSMKH